MSSKGPIQAPVWSSVEIVESVLRNLENDESIKVNNVTSKSATAKGDNYGSDMVRASVEYTRDNSGRRLTERKSLIFKIALNNLNSSGDMCQKFGVFEREIEMVENTLVKMNESLNEKDYRLSPRVYYSKIGDPSFLVMEDLAEQGFCMADRHARLDLQHCMLVIRGLAKFHASSVAIYEKDPNSIRLYERGIYHKDNPEEFKKFVRDGMKVLGNEVINWSELNPSYSEKLLKLSEVCFEKAVELARPKDDEFNVINHGDCWINNMLFRYNEEGKVIDHIFVDFQISFWGSPAFDILNFLGTSAMDDVLLHHRDALINEYMKTLVETMSRLGCRTKPPSPDSLRRSLSERRLLTVLSSTLTLPFVLIDKAEVVSFSEILSSEDGFVNPAYKTHAYREVMVGRLKEWNSQGILDV